MATKTVKASSLKTRKQYEEAVRKGWNIQYNDPYPAPPKKGTRKKSAKK